MKRKKTYNLRATTFAVLTATGLVLQLHAIELAKLERGRFAIGGEWLVLPLVLLIYAVAVEGIKAFKKMRKEYAEFSEKEKREAKEIVIQAFIVFTMLAIFSILSML